MMLQSSSNPNLLQTPKGNPPQQQQQQYGNGASNYKLNSSRPTTPGSSRQNRKQQQQQQNQNQHSLISNGSLSKLSQNHNNNTSSLSNQYQTGNNTSCQNNRSGSEKVVCSTRASDVALTRRRNNVGKSAELFQTTSSQYKYKVGDYSSKHGDVYNNTETGTNNNSQVGASLCNPLNNISDSLPPQPLQQPTAGPHSQNNNTNTINNTGAVVGNNQKLRSSITPRGSIQNMVAQTIGMGVVNDPQMFQDFSQDQSHSHCIDLQVQTTPIQQQQQQQHEAMTNNLFLESNSNSNLNVNQQLAQSAQVNQQKETLNPSCKGFRDSVSQSNTDMHQQTSARVVGAMSSRRPKSNQMAGSPRNIIVTARNHTARQSSTIDQQAQNNTTAPETTATMQTSRSKTEGVRPSMGFPSESGRRPFGLVTNLTMQQAEAQGRELTKKQPFLKRGSKQSYDPKESIRNSRSAEKLKKLSQERIAPPQINKPTATTAKSQDQTTPNSRRYEVVSAQSNEILKRTPLSKPLQLQTRPKPAPEKVEQDDPYQVVITRMPTTPSQRPVEEPAIIQRSETNKQQRSHFDVGDSLLLISAEKTDEGVASQRQQQSTNTLNQDLEDVVVPRQSEFKAEEYPHLERSSFMEFVSIEKRLQTNGENKNKITNNVTNTTGSMPQKTCVKKSGKDEESLVNHQATIATEQEQPTDNADAGHFDNSDGLQNNSDLANSMTSTEARKRLMMLGAAGMKNEAVKNLLLKDESSCSIIIEPINSSLCQLPTNQQDISSSPTHSAAVVVDSKQNLLASTAELKAVEKVLESANQSNSQLQLQQMNECSRFGPMQMQIEAQQVLIDNLRQQLVLTEEHNNLLMNVNKHLNLQLDTYQNKEFRDFCIQVDCKLNQNLQTITQATAPAVAESPKKAYGDLRTIGEDSCMLTERNHVKKHLEHGTEPVRIDFNEVPVESPQKQPLKQLQNDQKPKQSEVAPSTSNVQQMQQQQPEKPVNTTQSSFVDFDDFSIGNKDAFKMIFPQKYHSIDAENEDQIISRDQIEGKRIKIFASGKKQISFPSGVIRESYPDGYQVIYFENCDVRQQWPDGRMVYFFASQEITQTLLPNGVKVLYFKSGQLERHAKDGSKEICFQDGTKRYVDSQGNEIVV